ncbi:hypothetical protein F5887DRAFT_49521 [Amanita rubescens]|nr:hypothetical protein F5887DRAFT_49521 [Amanita rubescens]
MLRFTMPLALYLPQHILCDNLKSPQPSSIYLLRVGLRKKSIGNLSSKVICQAKRACDMFARSSHRLAVAKSPERACAVCRTCNINGLWDFYAVQVKKRSELDKIRQTFFLRLEDGFH